MEKPKEVLVPIHFLPSFKQVVEALGGTVIETPRSFGRHHYFCQIVYPENK